MNYLANQGKKGKRGVGLFDLKKRLVLFLAGEKYKTLAEILEPVLTVNNVQKLMGDKWFRKNILKVISKKTGDENKYDNRQMIHNKRARKMKISVNIDEIDVDKIKILIERNTSTTVAEVVSEVITEDNIRRVMSDHWIQEKLIGMLHNVVCDKGQASGGKMILNDIFTIKNISVE